MGRAGRGGLSADAELEALLLLRLLPGMGDRTLVRLLRLQGSARRALANPIPHPSPAGEGGKALHDPRSDPALRSRVDRIRTRCRELDIRIVPFGGPEYPAPLLALSDPPPVLFLRGDPGLLERPCVAIVGSRRASPVGRRAAERLAGELSAAGVTIVSGLAFGIDAAAHRGALRGAGRTVAVLGSGPDRAHPAGNRDLFARILREGLLVSEFPPGEPARPFHFPRRNRILAALTRAVVVVEAARRSGALITVDHALDLGLEVFAVPGSVELPQAEGTNALIRDGAHLITCGEDLLEVLGWTPSTEAVPMEATAAPPSPDRVPTPTGSGEERAVAEAVSGVPRALDDLVRGLGLPPSKVLAVLSRLELTGHVVRGPEGWRRPG